MAALKTELDVDENAEKINDNDRVEQIIDDCNGLEVSKKKKKKKKKKAGNPFSCKFNNTFSKQHD